MLTRFFFARFFLVSYRHILCENADTIFLLHDFLSTRGKGGVNTILNLLHDFCFVIDFRCEYWMRIFLWKWELLHTRVKISKWCFTRVNSSKELRLPFLSNRAVTLGSTCFLRAYVDPGTPLGRENKKIFSKILVLCVRSKQKHPIQLFE